MYYSIFFRVAMSLCHFFFRETLETLCTHSHSHLVRILNVTIGFLSLLYLFPFLLPKGTTLTSTLCLFCPSPSQLVSFFPKPLSKKTQPSVSFALFRANFICYLFSLYLSLTSNVGIYYLILYCTFSSKPTKWYAQKTATPIDSGITVCVEIYFYKPICQRRNPRICLSFYRDKDCPCAK